MLNNSKVHTAGMHFESNIQKIYKIKTMNKT